MPTARIPAIVCSVSLEFAEALNRLPVQARLLVLLLERGSAIFRVSMCSLTASQGITGVGVFPGTRADPGWHGEL
jgi:hypothetical protein